MTYTTPDLLRYIESVADVITSETNVTTPMTQEVLGSEARIVW